MSNTPDEEIVSAEACAILGIDRSTLTRRVQRGELQPSRKLPGATGPYLFRREDVEAARERQAAAS